MQSESSSVKIIFVDFSECVKYGVKIKPIKRYRRIKTYLLTLNDNNLVDYYQLISSTILKKKCISDQNIIISAQDINDLKEKLIKFLENNELPKSFIVAIKDKNINIDNIISIINEVVR